MEATENSLAYLTQQNAYKLLQKLGYHGITIPMIKGAVDSGALKIYKPGKRVYIERISLVSWAKTFIVQN